MSRLPVLISLILVVATATTGGAAQTPPPSPSSGAGAGDLVWLGNPVAGEPYTARRITDLQNWWGRIYLGYGDYYANLGPVDVWYYAPGAGEFRTEARLDEEAIFRYVRIGGGLYIPGTDPRDVGWTLGNFYRNWGAGWVKYRTIPFGVHTHDLAGGHGQLFAAAGGLWRSPNGGQSWIKAIAETGLLRFGELFVADGEVFAVQSHVASGETGPLLGLYRYEDARGVFTPLPCDLTADRVDPTGVLQLFMARDVVPFRGRILYVPFRSPTSDRRCTHPLRALYQAPVGGDGWPVPFFNGKHPIDIVATEDRVYVLDAGGTRCYGQAQGGPDPAGYWATIYASEDLLSWFPVAAGHFPDTPNALEVTGDYAYVGTYNGDVYRLRLRLRRYSVHLPLVCRASAGSSAR